MDEAPAKSNQSYGTHREIGNNDIPLLPLLLLLLLLLLLPPPLLLLLLLLLPEPPVRVTRGPCVLVVVMVEPPEVIVDVTALEELPCGRTRSASVLDC